MKKVTQDNKSNNVLKQIKIRQSNPATPRMMTVREIASTGILPENAIRTLLKQGKIPAIYSGKKALINFNLLCEMLQTLKPTA